MTPPHPPRLEDLLAYAYDPLGFTRRFLQWTPDAKQALALSTHSRNVILNCARQWGKTTVAASKIVHMAVTRPGSVSLIVAENLGQVDWVMRKIERFLTLVGITMKKDKRQWTLNENGSMIIGMAAREDGVRCYTADLVFLDEAARIDDEVIDALEPALAVRKGDLWMASTPKGRRGRFFEVWTYGVEGPELTKICVPASENPRMDMKFVEKARREKGEDFAGQEFGCQFVENGTNLMGLDSIDELVRARR